MQGPPVEALDDGMAIDPVDDHHEPTQEEIDGWMQDSIDAGFDPPEEPEPPPEPPVIGPPPPPPDTVYLIPSDELAENAIRNDRYRAIIARLVGLKFETLPIGTPARKGVPFYWANSDKYLGMAFTSGGCVFAGCNGRARMWLHVKYRDDRERFRIRVGLHEMGHIITGLGAKSRLDTLPSGHLEQGNMMDPSSNRWFTVLDGRYWCENAPCTHQNAEDVYIGNEPYWVIWPWQWSQEEDGGIFPNDAGIDAGDPSDGGFLPGL